jgi:hypothetical protein
MTIRKLEKSTWRPFFDRISDGLLGKRAEIEVASLDIGDQIEAEWLPIYGIVYDHKDDIIEIALEDLDHLVRSPREVYIDDGLTGLASVEIINGEGRKEIIQLRDPLMLPPPSAVTS